MENHFVKALEKIFLPPLPQRGSYLSPTHSCGAPSIWGLICIFSIGFKYLVLESIFMWRRVARVCVCPFFNRKLDRSAAEKAGFPLMDLKGDQISGGTRQGQEEQSYGKHL